MASLIYLMGPSGAGKDSLLAAAKKALPATIKVATRYITRPVVHDAEQHIALSEKGFLHKRQQGLFSLTWQAHGYYYGIGVEVDQWLDQGMHVIVNGSRAYLSEAYRRYQDKLLPVSLEVSPDILAARLKARGRENTEEIAKRHARAIQYIPPQDCIRIQNNGDLTQTLEDFRAILVRCYQKENEK